MKTFILFLSMNLAETLTLAATEQDCRAAKEQLVCTGFYYLANNKEVRMKQMAPLTAPFVLQIDGDGEGTCVAQTGFNDTSYGFKMSADASMDRTLTVSMNSVSTTMTLMPDQTFSISYSPKPAVPGKGTEAGLNLYQVNVTCGIR
jgi:hypothetical protein